jgi:hypothetical protein
VKADPSQHDPDSIAEGSGSESPVKISVKIDWGWANLPAFPRQFDDLRFAVYEAAALMHLKHASVETSSKMVSATYGSIPGGYPSEERRDDITCRILFGEPEREVGQNWEHDPFPEYNGGYGRFVGKLTDPDQLFGKFLTEINFPDSSIPLLEEELNLWRARDEKTAVDAALNSEDAHLREEALDKLSGPVSPSVSAREKLASLAVEDAYADTRLQAFDLLPDSVSTGHGWEPLPAWAPLAARVATEDKDLWNRAYAVNKIRDQTLLLKISASDESAKVRSMAKDRIKCLQKGNDCVLCNLDMNLDMTCEHYR